VSWALLALALAAAADDAEAPEPDFTPGAALWLQPVGLVVLPFASPRTAYVALGATAVMAGGLELSTELTLWHSQTDAMSPSGFREVRRAVTFAIGPVFHTGDAPLGGFFVEPKAIAELGQEYGVGGFQSTFDGRGASGFYAVQVGISAGWQLRWKRLYLMLSLGGSVGVGSRSLTTLGPIVFTQTFPPRSFGFQWGLDLNLLRIGVAL